MPRFKDANWDFPATNAGAIQTWEHIDRALLMDIRDELKKLNLLLHCPRFTFIPHTLDAIRKNTTKPKRRKKPRKEIVYGKAARKSKNPGR